MLRLYAGDWACFQAYCAAAGARALPQSPSWLPPSSPRPAAIDHQHRQLGYPPPGLDAGVRAALRQARRASPPDPGRPAEPGGAHPHAGACHGGLAGQRDRTLLAARAAQDEAEAMRRQLLEPAAICHAARVARSSAATRARRVSCGEVTEAANQVSVVVPDQKLTVSLNWWTAKP